MLNLRFSGFCLAACWLACAAAVSAPPAQVSPPSAAAPKTITPQALAFINAVINNDAATVGRMLKMTPALANMPPAYFTGHSGNVSDLPLLEAAYHQNLQIATLLLKAGAKVNAENYFGETALDVAAFFSHADMVTLLLAHGAEIRHQNPSGETALHQAVRGDDPDVVAVLLAHGAEVNARDNEGKTPLAWARKDDQPNRAAVVAVLRQHGAKG